MAIKHRNFRKANSNITPYMMWILVGLAMGKRIVHNKSNTRLYLLASKNNYAQSYVHASAVNSLLKKKLVALNADKTAFKLTTTGFDIAHSRMKKCKAKVSNG